MPDAPQDDLLSYVDQARAAGAIDGLSLFGPCVAAEIEKYFPRDEAIPHALITGYLNCVMPRIVSTGEIGTEELLRILALLPKSGNRRRALGLVLGAHIDTSPHSQDADRTEVLQVVLALHAGFHVRALERLAALGSTVEDKFWDIGKDGLAALNELAGGNSDGGEVFRQKRFQRTGCVTWFDLVLRGLIERKTPALKQ